jgi:hypothetical protein
MCWWVLYCHIYIYIYIYIYIHIYIHIYTHIERKFNMCRIHRHTSTCTISSYAFSDWRRFRNSKEKILVMFLNRAPHVFSLRDPKRNERKVTEEYCRAITQATWLSCCVHSGSSVLECGFKLEFYMIAYIAVHKCTHLALAVDLNERDWCVSWEVCL